MSKVKIQLSDGWQNLFREGKNTGNIVKQFEIDIEKDTSVL